MVARGNIRKDMILHKLKQIEENLILIEENLPPKFGDFLKLGLAKDGIYKRVESMLENVIDICSIINSDLGLGIPSDEDNIIDNLFKDNILSSVMADKIKEMKGFRNILVHRYGEIEDKKAFHDITKGIGDFSLFIKRIRKFLSQNQKSTKK